MHIVLVAVVTAVAGIAVPLLRVGAAVVFGSVIRTSVAAAVIGTRLSVGA